MGETCLQRIHRVPRRLESLASRHQRHGRHRPRPRHQPFLRARHGRPLATRLSRSAVAALNGTLFAALILVTIRGLSLGKWVHNVSAILLLVTYGALIALPFIARATGKLPEYHPIQWVLPSASLFSLNIFNKMALGALSGFEYVAILAGETRALAKNIGRSVLIAAPIIALMFILGTSSVMAYTRFATSISWDRTPSFERGRASIRPVWLRIAAAVGFMVTLLYIVLTIFPIVRVKSDTEFAAKIIFVTIAANLLGGLIFIAGKRRSRSTKFPPDFGGG